AEDGIRDRNVTGVQTCALPILRIRVHGVGSMTLPKRLMINVFDRPMNSANLPWHFSYGILLSTFYFWRRPHINNRGNTVVDHLRSEERRVGKEWRSRWAVEARR